MKLDENTIKYSSFAVIAIESVWPNPEGNESPPDFFDFDLLGVSDENIVKGGNKRETFQTASFSNTRQDYQSRKGYYKLLPLNILRLDTKATVSGSQFQVSFTLDDLILVADSNADFLDATGLPLNRQDLIDLGDTKKLPIFFGGNDKGDWEYVRDDQLGLTRYKINGASSAFNVEDLVEPNDTVSIWFYHDPSDFYLKAETPQNTEVVDDIKNIIGSGDRRGQFVDETSSFSEYILNVLGLDVKFLSDRIDAVVEGREDEVVEADLSLDDVVSAVGDFVDEALDAVGTKSQLVERFSRFSDGFGIPKSSVAYRYLLFPFAFPNLSFSDVSENADIDSISENPNENLEEPSEEVDSPEDEESSSSGVFSNEQKTEELRQKIKGFIRESWDGEQFSPPEEYFDLISIPAFRFVTSENELAVENFVLGLNQYKNFIESKLTEYVEQNRSGRTYSLVDQRFSNGRQALINDFTGETPYLILKGKIGSISTSVGPSTGAHTVTISGEGYEKTLKEQEVFYEEAFFPDTFNFSGLEYKSLYINILPPRAMIDVVNRHASKALVFKKPEDIIEEESHERLTYLAQELGFYSAVLPGTAANKGKFFQNNVLARGNFIISKYIQDLSFEDIRVANPINFIDTTRIQEMVRALNNSYSEEEVLYRNTQELRGGSSVYQNLRMLGGTELLYEMFVDELGRIRYRYSFEAYERTPRPIITPIIQDDDVLNGARFMVDDSNVVTAVTVRPGDSAVSEFGQEIPYLGRAVSERGEVPMEKLAVGDLGEQLNDSLREIVAPDMFRYGIQSLDIEDVYTSPADSSEIKAQLYMNFFGKPLKQANITIPADPSYRIGNTVLVSLQKNKHRSQTVVETQKFLNWLRFIRTREELVNLYIGVDERLIRKETFIATSGEYTPFSNGGFGGNQEGISSNQGLYEEFRSNPKLFVLDQFIRTFEYLLSKNINLVTPEYFPTNYWFFNSGGNGFVGLDGKTIDSGDIISLYDEVLNLAVNGLQNPLNQQVSSSSADTAEVIDRLNSSEVQELLTLANNSNVYGDSTVDSSSLSGDINSENFDSAISTLNKVISLLTSPDFIPLTSDDVQPLTELRTLTRNVVSSNAAVAGRESSLNIIQQSISQNPGILSALKFQDFRVASYYIQGVNHKFEHGKNAVTSLQLNYGQDNLVLLEPKNNLPVGFISLEKNMRLNYESESDDKLYLDGREESGEQKMYWNQWQENNNFEQGSILYRAQEIRNSSIYMYELGVLDNLSAVVNEEPSQDSTNNQDIDVSYNRSIFGEFEFEEAEVDTRGTSKYFWELAGPKISQKESELGRPLTDEEITSLEQKFIAERISNLNLLTFNEVLQSDQDLVESILATIEDSE